MNTVSFKGTISQNLCVAVVMALAFASGAWATPPTVQAPVAVNSNAGSDAVADYNPRMATDGEGHWVAIWRAEFDVMVAYSWDDGATWSTAIDLHPGGATVTDNIDNRPDIATDGAGVWIAVWHTTDTMGGTIGSDDDILFSRSTDNGANWSSPAPLNGNYATLNTDWGPQVAASDTGRWMAVWNSTEGTVADSKRSERLSVGIDHDILYALSDDAGQTWSSPRLLNTNGTSDYGYDYAVRLNPVYENGWVAVWSTDDSFRGAYGSDYDSFAAVWDESTESWSAPTPLNTNAGSDSLNDVIPEVATGSDGTCVAVWCVSHADAADSYSIFGARSTNGGQTWSAPFPLSRENQYTNVLPDLDTDGHGNWLALWWSTDPMDGAYGTDSDILAVLSTDNGLTWSEPFALNAGAATDSDGDSTPQVVMHRGSPDTLVSPAGVMRWATIWFSRDSLGGTVGTDRDIFFARVDPYVILGNPKPPIVSLGAVSFDVDYLGVDFIDLISDDVSLMTSGNVTGDVGVGDTGERRRRVTVSNVAGTGSLSISLAAGTATSIGGAIGAVGPSTPATVAADVPVSGWFWLVALVLAVGVGVVRRNCADRSGLAD